MPVDVPSVGIVEAVLALAGLAIAGSSVWAAVAARGTRHELQNGMSSTLGRIESRQLAHEKRELAQDGRLERMEGKIDRAHARINDVNDQVQQFRRENRS